MNLQNKYLIYDLESGSNETTDGVNVVAFITNSSYSQ